MPRHEVIVHRRLNPAEALEILTPALAPRYEVTRTPEDEIYVKRGFITRAIVKVATLPDERTSFKVRPDLGPGLPGWLYNGLAGTKQVASAISQALN